MRNKYRNTINALIVFVIIFVVMLISGYFIVSGNEIADRLMKYKDMEWVITKYEHAGVVESETVLNDVQRSELIALLRGMKARRMLFAQTVYSNNMTRYEVQVHGTYLESYGYVTGVLMKFHSTGGDYMFVSEMFKDKPLKIYGDKWNDGMEAVLNKS